MRAATAKAVLCARRAPQRGGRDADRSASSFVIVPMHALGQASGSSNASASKGCELHSGGSSAAGYDRRGALSVVVG